LLFSWLQACLVKISIQRASCELFLSASKRSTYISHQAQAILYCCRGT